MSKIRKKLAIIDNGYLVEIIRGFKDLIDMESDQNTKLGGSSHSDSSKATLFVGCLDPRTTEDDFTQYFRQYDSGCTTKLLIDFETFKFKQCGLVYCSSREVLQTILLSKEHFLLGRKIRVQEAKEELKGKKIGRTFQIQISGLLPSTKMDHIKQAFEEYEGIVKFRFVEGIHPKQKKVAIITFNNQKEAERLLLNTHFNVGGKLCKVSRYIQKGSTYPYPISLQGQEPTSLFQYQSVFAESLTNNKQPYHPFRIGKPLEKLNLFDKSSADKKPNLFLSGFSNPQPNSELYVSSERKSSSVLLPNQYVHPVEVEDDSLYKIFCSTDQPSIPEEDTNHHISENKASELLSPPSTETKKGTKNLVRSGGSSTTRETVSKDR